MTAIITGAARPEPPGPLTATLAFGYRALLKIRHVPEQLFDVIAIPVVFTLMFTYLFGGALAGSPGRYLPFLLPGTLVMAVLLVSMYAGIGLNTDVSKGITGRFRSLPIWRPALVAGAIVGDRRRGPARRLRPAHRLPLRPARLAAKLTRIHPVPLAIRSAGTDRRDAQSRPVPLLRGRDHSCGQSLRFFSGRGKSPACADADRRTAKRWPPGLTTTAGGSQMTAESVITDRVAEMHAAMAKEPPNEVMGAFGREQAALAAAGPPAGIAGPGPQLADAELLDAHGAPTSLYKAAGDGTAVLVFYQLGV